MKRFFKWALIIITLLIALAAAGLFIFIKTFDINRYKPQIIAAAQTALGRKVDFADITLNVTLKNGIRASVHDIKVDEHSSFGKGAFLTVKEVFVGVDILAYALRDEISLPKIQVVSPRVVIIRGKDDQINAQTFAAAPQPAAIPANGPSPVKAPVEAPMALPAIAINALNVVDASVVYVDRGFDQEFTAEISRIDFALSGFSLTETFSFSLKAAILHDSQNINLNGRAKINADDMSGVLSGLELAIDLGKLDLAVLKDYPPLSGVPLPGLFKGQARVVIPKLDAGARGIKELLLHADITDGAVKMNNGTRGINLNIPAFELSLKNVTLTDEPFQFRASAAFLNAGPNITLKGTGTLNAEKLTVSLNSTTAVLDLASLSLARVSADFPPLKDIPLPQAVKGKLTADIVELRAGAKGLESLSGRADLVDGSMRLKELAVPFEGVNAHLTLSESVIGMEHLNAGIGEGTLKANGSLSDYLGRQIYQLGLDLKDVKMAELIDQTEFPVKVQGTVLSALKIKGQGFDPAVMFDPLSGGGSFELTDGKLTDINILKVVLDKIAVVPNFRQVIEDSIPPKYKEKIRQKDTILTKVSATLMIQNGRVNIAPIDLNADSFLFEGTGSVGFDQTFDMQGSFIIPADLAAAMVAAVGELELLQDFDGTIRFPLKVEGKGAALKFAPDIKSIGNAVIKNKARQEIGNILNKVLKTDGETAAPPSQPQSPAPSSPTDTPPAKDKSAEQILIENILDKIFK